MTRQEWDKAFLEGYNARGNGAKRGDCPYRKTSRQQDAWEAGWMQRDGELR